MVFTSEPLNSKVLRVYNFGFMFGYSNDLSGSETVTFINEENSSGREIDGTPYWPERVFVSFCESYQIFAYDGYFIIYKVEEGGSLTYFRSVQETVNVRVCRSTKGCSGRNIFSFLRGSLSTSCK
jgi:hypothetical protein